MNDPIVDEVRRIRDAYAARFNYDLDAIFRDLKEKEKKSGHKFVAGVARPATPSQALQPTRAATPLAQNSEIAPATERQGSRGESS
jgi:hypothetical protein